MKRLLPAPRVHSVVLCCPRFLSARPSVSSRCFLLPVMFRFHAFPTSFHFPPCTSSPSLRCSGSLAPCRRCVAVFSSHSDFHVISMPGSSEQPPLSRVLVPCVGVKNFGSNACLPLSLCTRCVLGASSPVLILPVARCLFSCAPAPFPSSMGERPAALRPPRGCA